MLRNGDSLCEYLAWDSEFFGIRIARIKSYYLNNREIKNCIYWCQEHNIACVYFLIDPARVNSIYNAESNGFHLVDIRLTLETDISKNPYFNMPLNAIKPMVREADRNDIIKIKKITRENHHQTRFFKDKHFPQNKSAELYGLWVEQGFDNLRGIVLVAQVKRKIAGYIVVQIGENNTGSIVLFGVDKIFRYRGLGAELVCAALRWFKINGAIKVRVVTQGANIPAYRHYSRWGFLPCETMLWYHHWFMPGEE